MPSYAESRCTRCGKLTDPLLLTIKRVQFAEQTNPRKSLKIRTTERLCERCRDADPDWNLEAYRGPNNQSAPLEREREASNGR